ncbi:hypothetical protein NL108_018667 [Boleophthalmus pectinirostris]|nr:hypothetical protein NL108_018667 [Boleophthalmus pectinirostris]
MDIESLYTNIDHKDGLMALEHYLKKRTSETMPPAGFILKLTEWTLKNNIFLFQQQLYKQQKGTAMGACFAPNYANLYLSFWEENYVFSNLNNLRDKILWWGRYIDDVILLWSGSEQELLQFHSYLNNTNVNIKLSLDYSLSEIHFLDLNIYKDLDGDLHSTIFRKLTDRNTILKADSFHPPWLLQNIPYGQFQRLRRICDTESNFEKNAQDMSCRFKNRGYTDSTLSLAYNRAKSLNREELLTQKPKKNVSTNQVYFVTEYGTEANRIKQIIKQNWSILRSDSTLRDALPETPTITFRKAPTLSDRLVNSYLPPLKQKTWLDTKAGCYRCGNCTFCEHVQQTNLFMDINSGQSFYIRTLINCNTTYVVYRLECPCGRFYVGRTKRKLKNRLAEHKQATRTYNPLYPMAVHYKEANHGSCKSLKVCAIEHIKETIRGGDRLKKLLQRETYWIYTLKATQFPGLNGELDFSPFL